MIVFRTCAAAEHEINWYGDLWTLHSDLAEVKDAIDTMVVSITDKVLRHMEHEGAYHITMCFSSYPYFRSKVYPPYKLNRVAKRKPLAYHSAVEWVKKNYNVLSIPSLEADDILGIYGTIPSTSAVIISGDKDMRSIPCPFTTSFRIHSIRQHKQKLIINSYIRHLSVMLPITTKVVLRLARLVQRES